MEIKAELEKGNHSFTGKMKTQPIAGTYWYKFNTEKAPFNNVKIRKAFAYSIDRQALIDNVLQAGQLPATGAVPPSMALNKDGYYKGTKASGRFSDRRGRKSEGYRRGTTMAAAMAPMGTASESISHAASIERKGCKYCVWLTRATPPSASP